MRRIFLNSIFNIRYLILFRISRFNIRYFFCFITYSLFLIHYCAATHNRAGEITYRHVGSDRSLEYEITITTYTRTSSVQADRPTLDSVHLGDGTFAQFIRINGPLNNGIPYGDELPGDIKYNIYKIN